MIPEIKKRVLHRIRIIQGQAKGLEKMIENEEYCMEIFTQSLAIQKSLRSLNKLVLENHMRTHVAEKLEGEDEKVKSRILQELMDMYELSTVRG